MALLVLGDCHACWPMLVRAVARGVTEHGVTAVIQVGDFGFFPIYLPGLWDTLQGAPFPVPVHAIDGNHEDHRWLWSQLDAGTGERWAADHRLIVHRRGAVSRIDGLSVGFLGGALHADRHQQGQTAKRTTNWVMDREADAAATAFTAAAVDLVVTHSCPSAIGVGMSGTGELSLAIERYITAAGFHAGPPHDCGEPGLHRLWHRLQHHPRHWVFGHFHTHRESQVDGTAFRCVGTCDDDGPVHGHLFAEGVWRRVELD